MFARQFKRLPDRYRFFPTTQAAVALHDSELKTEVFEVSLKSLGFVTAVIAPKDPQAVAASLPRCEDDECEEDEDLEFR